MNVHGSWLSLTLRANNLGNITNDSALTEQAELSLPQKKLLTVKQRFIGVHNETLSVAAMRVSNPDRSVAGIHG